MSQSNGFVHGHSAATLFRLTITLVPRVHVLLRKITAKEVEVGAVQRDQLWIHQVLYLQQKQKDEQKKFVDLISLSKEKNE